MPERLFNALAARPERPTLGGNGQCLSAGELLTWVNQLAAGLAGTRVLAVLADNGPAWAALDLAALRAGVAHLPLPGFFSPQQMAHALDSAGADLVLSDAPERILALNLGFVPHGEIAGLSALRRQTAPRTLPVGTIKISFTSGSTGQPRGVCLSAAGLMDTAEAVSQAMTGLALTRHLAVLPLPLLLENVAGLYAALLHGAEVQLPGLAELGWRGMAGFDPIRLLDCLHQQQPSSVILVPELLKAWTLALEAVGARAHPGLKMAAVGGARTAPDFLIRAEARGIPAYEGYGLTEGGSVLCLNRPDAARPGSAGRPLGHALLRVDAAGEVHATGRLALGYLGDAPLPVNADGLTEIATGDLGRLDAEGFLYLEGRRKNLLITGYGRNVSPEWVEAALTAQPEILQALAVGEARPWLAALLTPASGADAQALEQAVQRANAALPDYARVAAWTAVPPFLAADGLATGNGRPLRQAILARHAARIESLYLPAKETSHAVL